MNFYTVAARINKQIDKGVDLAKRAGHENLDEWRTAITRQEMSTARRNMELGIDLMLMFKEIAADKGLTDGAARTWFITVRPDTNLITFDAFYQIVHQFVHRKCFKTYTLSFEQKGTNEETLGHGFHVHIVANMTQRSKGEVLRDTQSSFKDCTAKNCIDVSIAKTPTRLIEQYLVQYESDDNHKIATKPWDEQWRLQESLAPLYVDNLDARIIPVALSSPGGLLEFD